MVAPKSALRFAALTALSTLLAGTATAQPKRELSAHEHGAGTLNIAIEQGRIEMELEVPADDIVGFEHVARTTKQKAAVSAAKKTLGAPLALFKLPSAAGCKLETTKVEVQVEAPEKSAAAPMKTEPAKDKHGHAHADHKDHKDEAGHSEFHATYTLVCSAPDKIAEIAFGYFASFKKAEKLTVNIVSASGQKQYQVTRKSPRLTLGGAS